MNLALEHTGPVWTRQARGPGEENSAVDMDPMHTGPLRTRQAHGSGARRAVVDPPRHVAPRQTAPSWTRQARGSGAHKASWMRQARGSGTHRGLCGHAKHLDTACKGLQRLAKHVASAPQEGPLDLPGLWFRQLLGARKPAGRLPWHQDAETVGNTTKIASVVGPKAAIDPAPPAAIYIGRCPPRCFSDTCSEEAAVAPVVADDPSRTR